MKTEDVKLKSCPFCGSGGNDRNNRPVEDQLKAQNKELLEALKKAVTEICSSCPGDNMGDDFQCSSYSDCFVKNWIKVIQKAT